MDSDHTEVYDYPFYRGAMQELKGRWKRGELNSRVSNLRNFVRRYLDDIQKVTREEIEEQRIEQAVRDLFISIGTLDFVSDMKDQAEEINKEIWIRGERGDDDKVQILFDWTSEHAHSWRRWRNLECLYVIEKKAAKIYREFLENEPSESDQNRKV